MKIMLTSKLQILLEKYDRKNFREWGAEKINIMAKIVGRVTYNHQANMTTLVYDMQINMRTRFK